MYHPLPNKLHFNAQELSYIYNTNEKRQPHFNFNQLTSIIDRTWTNTTLLPATATVYRVPFFIAPYRLLGNLYGVQDWSFDSFAFAWICRCHVLRCEHFILSDHTLCKCSCAELSCSSSNSSPDSLTVWELRSQTARHTWHTCCKVAAANCGMKHVLKLKLKLNLLASCRTSVECATKRHHLDYAERAGGKWLDYCM